MDFLLLIGIAVALLVILITVLFLRKKEEQTEEAAPRRRTAPIRLQPTDIGGSRAQIARNQRNRARQATIEQNRQQQQVVAADVPQHVEENDDDGGTATVPGDLGKIGAKKRAKLEAKAEKKAHREVELQMREDKKKREALADEERRKDEEKEKEEEQKREEAERLARELKEKQEYEEYLKMKAAFTVDEEGFDENMEADGNSFLTDFINFIKNNKVVVLEELAREFKLKTQAVIDRIHELKAEGVISGVIDDRGKFIYISEEELTSVAKFVRQRGRISIAELVESSNELINLAPVSLI